MADLFFTILFREECILTCLCFFLPAKQTLRNLWFFLFLFFFFFFHNFTFLDFAIYLFFPPPWSIFFFCTVFRHPFKKTRDLFFSDPSCFFVIAFHHIFSHTVPPDYCRSGRPSCPVFSCSWFFLSFFLCRLALFFLLAPFFSPFFFRNPVSLAAVVCPFPSPLQPTAIHAWLVFFSPP